MSGRYPTPEKKHGGKTTYLVITMPLHPDCWKDAEKGMRKYGIPFQSGVLPGTDMRKLPMGIAHGYVEVPENDLDKMKEKLDSLKGQYSWLDYSVVRK